MLFRVWIYLPDTLFAGMLLTGMLLTDILLINIFPTCRHDLPTDILSILLSTHISGILTWHVT